MPQVNSGEVGLASCFKRSPRSVIREKYSSRLKLRTSRRTPCGPSLWGEVEGWRDGLGAA
jgi:hypothetical protein